MTELPHPQFPTRPPMPKKRRRWIVVLSLTLGAAVAASSGAYYMMWMPGTSYAGPAEPLVDEEAAIRNGLKKHIEKLPARSASVTFANTRLCNWPATT